MPRTMPSSLKQWRAWRSGPSAFGPMPRRSRRLCWTVTTFASTGRRRPMGRGRIFGDLLIRPISLTYARPLDASARWPVSHQPCSARRRRPSGQGSTNARIKRGARSWAAPRRPVLTAASTNRDRDFAADPVVGSRRWLPSPAHTAPATASPEVFDPSLTRSLNTRKAFFHIHLAWRQYHTP